MSGGSEQRLRMPRTMAGERKKVQKLHSICFCTPATPLLAPSSRRRDRLHSGVSWITKRAENKPTRGAEQADNKSDEDFASVTPNEEPTTSPTTTTGRVEQSFSKIYIGWKVKSEKVFPDFFPCSRRCSPGHRTKVHLENYLWWAEIRRLNPAWVSCSHLKSCIFVFRKERARGRMISRHWSGNFSEMKRKFLFPFFSSEFCRKICFFLVVAPPTTWLIISILFRWLSWARATS